MRIRRKNFLFLIFILAFTLIFNYILYSVKQSFTKKYLQINNPKLSQSRKYLFDILNKQCNATSIRISPKICSDALFSINESISKNDCSECLYGTENNEISIVRFHTFWELKKNEKKFEYQLRVLRLNIMSYLATQNLCCSRYFLWYLNELNNETTNYILKTFNTYIKNKTIQLMQFNFDELCKTSNSYRNHVICKKKFKLNVNNLIGFSDFLRFFILDQYSGIWFDGDTVLLRNFNLFYNFNFAYTWGKKTNVLNTAALGINKKIDSSINKLYDILLDNKTTLGELVNAFHPYSVSREIRLLNKNSIFNYKSLKVVSLQLFDPAWLCFEKLLEGKQYSLNPQSVCILKGFCFLNLFLYLFEFIFDNFLDFTDKTFIKPKEFNVKNFFPGSFSYHIHSDCGPRVLETSYFYYLEDYFEKLI
jgi:hypothetical protein